MRRSALDLNSTICVLRAHDLPSVQELLPVLHQCRQQKNTHFLHLLHTLLCKHGLEVHAVLANHLIRAFVESDEFFSAEIVFERLLDRNEDDWTSFMYGCIDNGRAGHAVNLYRQMQENGRPSACASVAQASLKACAKLRDAISGQNVHLHIVKFGFEADAFIGSALVDMYAKSGPIAAAFHIFDRLRDRDVVLWTTIVSGLVEHGFVADALKCMDNMQAEGVAPNAVTFSCLLKGFKSKVFSETVCQSHTEAVKQGFENELCVSSSLVGAYAKCGKFVEAQRIFQKLPARDVILWTTLITSYAEEGFEDASINCLDQMEREGVVPNVVTYMCILKSFGEITFRQSIYKIHSQLVFRGLENIDPVGGMLVFTYGRCELLDDAVHVLDGLPVQDIFSCNSLLLTFMEQGLDDSALQCIDKMQVEGVSSNAFTYVCGLKACARQHLIERGLGLHVDITKDEFENDSHVACALVDMYSKWGFFPEAWAVVQELSGQSTPCWTALISGYLENGHFKEALNCLRDMQDRCMTLDAVTYVCGLKACTGSQILETGQQLHAELVKDGYEKEASIGNSLVDMYAKCGLLREAEDVFEELPIQQLVSWTALMSGYIELKHWEKALELYDRVPMKKLPVDSIVFLSSLRACGNLGALDKGQMIHTDIAKEGFEEDPAISSSLVDMYAKCGFLSEALEVLDGTVTKSVVLWTSLLTGFACQGNSKAVCHICDRLSNEGVQPDDVTFLNVVTVCSHDGLVKKGLLMFEAISQAAMITPTIELHNCLMDLVSRAGRLFEALIVVEEMPFQPNLVAWNTILGACQKWRSVPVGELAFWCALKLDCKQSAVYTSMISIYADACMWEDVSRIDNLREMACHNHPASS